MNLNDGPLLLLASASLFGWGVALGLWFERNRPGGTLDLREQRDKARNLVSQLRRAKAPHHPAYGGDGHAGMPSAVIHIDGRLDENSAAALARGQMHVVKDDVS